MERIIVEDIFDIAELMYDRATDNGEDVCFIGYYEDAILLIKELLAYDETKVCQIEIETVEFGNYDKEYLVTLDGEMNIWCQKAYQEEYKRYLIIGDDCVLIADDCNSKILNTIETDEIYEVGYDLDGECDGDCENCHLGEPDRHEVITRVATDDNGRLRGFEKSWETKENGMTYHSTYQFYSSDEKMLKDMLENFKIKY